MTEQKKSRSGSENRRSRKVRSARLSDVTDAQLELILQAEGLSFAGWVTKMVAAEPPPRQRIARPVNDNVKAAIQLKATLSREGNNLNQIAHGINFANSMRAPETRPSDDKIIAALDAAIAAYQKLYAVLTDATSGP